MDKSTIIDTTNYILETKMGLEISKPIPSTLVKGVKYKVVICADVIHGDYIPIDEIYCDGVCFNIYGGRANVFLAKNKRESNPNSIANAFLHNSQFTFESLSKTEEVMIPRDVLEDLRTYATLHKRAYEMCKEYLPE